MKVKSNIAIALPNDPPSNSISRRTWENFCERCDRAWEPLGYERSMFFIEIQDSMHYVYILKDRPVPMHVVKPVFAIKQIEFGSVKNLQTSILKTLADIQADAIDDLPEQPLTKPPAWADPNIDQYVEANY